MFCIFGVVDQYIKRIEAAMQALQHKAFYLSHDGDRDWLMDCLENGKDPCARLGVDGLRGEVFSNRTLSHFITEEIRHEHYEIRTGNNPSLVTSSSGEQRKALLSYIISREPGYIVLDNVFESIDQQSRQSILSSLTELARTTLLLQVFNRKTELLPFIESIYVVRGRNLGDVQGPGKFRETNKDLPGGNFTAAIPPPLVSFEKRQGPLIKMNKVSVQFDGRPVLRDISWEINPGEFWQLTGPNGSGKTTLLSLITGNSPKGYGQDLYLFGHRKGSGETVWDIKQQIRIFYSIDDAAIRKEGFRAPDDHFRVFRFCGIVHKTQRQAGATRGAMGVSYRNARTKKQNFR
jgi:molybdate transport system ATP-binding protein